MANRDPEPESQHQQFSDEYLEKLDSQSEMETELNLMTEIAKEFELPSTPHVISEPLVATSFDDEKGEDDGVDRAEGNIPDKEGN